MVIEYTTEERKQLAEINLKYKNLYEQKNTEIRKDNKNKSYSKTIEEFDELEAAYYAEIAEIREKAEAARFKALNNDKIAILEEAKKQVGLIIEERINYDLIRDENGSGIMEKLFSGNITQLEAENLIKETDFISRYEKEKKPVISSLEARTLIYSGLKKFTDFLKPYKKEFQELNAYISNYIAECIYIYTYTQAPNADPIAINEDIRKPLQRIKTYGLMNDKIVHQLIAGDFTSQDINGQLSFLAAVNQFETKNKGPVIVTMALTFTGENAALLKRMTAFDNAVYNAISTAFYYHKRKGTKDSFYITPQEIWRLMNGTQDTRKNPSPGQISKVCNSMDKMRFTRLYMDISEELKTFKMKINDERITKGKIDTYLLKSDKVSFTTEKGKQIVGYRIDNEPILYTYNAAKNRILYVPFDLLDTTNTTGNEGNTIEFRNYLLQQIQLMYEGKRDSKRILYKSIYEATGIETPESRINKNIYSNENTRRSATTQEAKKDREKIAAILKAWKEKEYILDFSPVIKGRAFIGIDIELNRVRLTTKTAEK